MDALCVDPSLTATQLLAHMPVYLARSERLVILWGPELLSSALCVAQLLCWRLLGGAARDVDIVPVAEDAQGLEAVMASADVFHVRRVVSSSPQILEQVRVFTTMLTEPACHALLAIFMPALRASCALLAREFGRSGPSAGHPDVPVRRMRSRGQTAGLSPQLPQLAFPPE
mmetsp:Transcript_4114/g.13762  ORF Transcript_4114/g.13762 Transcript_4114/m.13762 type:complete len:171 (-) Transcript_4114:140-652(-)